MVQSRKRMNRKQKGGERSLPPLLDKLKKEAEKEHPEIEDKKGYFIGKYRDLMHKRNPGEETKGEKEFEANKYRREININKTIDDKFIETVKKNKTIFEKVTSEINVDVERDEHLQEHENKNHLNIKKQNLENLKGIRPNENEVFYKVIDNKYSKEVLYLGKFIRYKEHKQTKFLNQRYGSSYLRDPGTITIEITTTTIQFTFENDFINVVTDNRKKDDYHMGYDIYKSNIEKEKELVAGPIEAAAAEAEGGKRRTRKAKKSKKQRKTKRGKKTAKKGKKSYKKKSTRRRH